MRENFNFCSCYTIVPRTRRFILSVGGFVVIIFIIINAIFKNVSYASDEAIALSNGIQELLDKLQIQDLESIIEKNQFLNNYGGTAKEIITALINGDLKLDYQSLWNGLFSKLVQSFSKHISIFIEILAVSIFYSLLKMLSDSMINEHTYQVVRVVCLVSVIVLLGTIIISLAKNTYVIINKIKTQIEVVIPILITLSVVTGATATAAISQPIAIFLTSSIIEFFSLFVVPITVCNIIINLLSKLNPDFSFVDFCKLNRSIIKWCVGLLITLFGIFVTLQSNVSQTYDGLLFKTTKYLVGSSIPIVGNFLSGGLDIFLASGIAIKNSIGLCGLIVLIVQILDPLIMILACNLFLKFNAAILSFMDVGEVASILTNLSEDLNYFIISILVISFLYVLLILSLINSVNLV